MNELELPALDGANPLGFLAALGTLVVLSETDPTIKLGWHARARWTPFLQSTKTLGEDVVVGHLLTRLRVGNAADNSTVPEEVNIGPLSQCTPDALHEFAAPIAKNASLQQRRASDMVAAFGIERIESKKDATAIQRTPFCFTTGSGHQEFIADAHQLMTRKKRTKAEPNPGSSVNEERIRAAIFSTWSYSDPGLSLRWDPEEDVRYALRLEDPGPVGAHTVWMANLLAYRALTLFPGAEVHGRLAVCGWHGTPELDIFSWPLWKSPLSALCIRSLICHQALATETTQSSKVELRARGVATVLMSRRIKVGSKSQYKVSFSQSQQV